MVNGGAFFGPKQIPAKAGDPVLREHNNLGRRRLLDTRFRGYDGRCLWRLLAPLRPGVIALRRLDGMDAAFGLRPASPATGPRVFISRGPAGGGPSADRLKTLCRERMP